MQDNPTSCGHKSNQSAAAVCYKCGISVWHVDWLATGLTVPSRYQSKVSIYPLRLPNKLYPALSNLWTTWIRKCSRYKSWYIAYNCAIWLIEYLQEATSLLFYSEPVTQSCRNHYHVPIFHCHKICCKLINHWLIFYTKPVPETWLVIKYL